MSLSREERIANFNLALERMVRAVDDQAYWQVLITPGSDKYAADIHFTTWLDLESSGYVVPVLGGHSRVLTGLGWMRGMEALGMNGDAAFKSTLGKLCGHLKDQLNGRQQQVLVSVANVALGTGLPIGLVQNIVDAGLIDAWLRRQGPRWAHKGNLISVPANFGLEIL